VLPAIFMKHSNSIKILLSFFLLCAFQISKAQTVHLHKDKIVITTKKGQSILVTEGEIYLNKKLIYKYEEDPIIYESKYNTLIEDNSTLLLFLTVSGSPNKDRIEAFRLTATKAVNLVDAIASKITDLDHDGYLEFGGADLTEVHPHKDSMYYIPTAYYEIKKGAIHLDAALTKRKDIELNGIYLKQQLDKNGNCCKVIKKPRRAKK